MTHLTPSRAAIQRAAYEFIASEVGDDLPGMTDQAERFVDHLIASGAVIDATTLADNDAVTSAFGKHIQSTYSNGGEYPAEIWQEDARDLLRGLADALTEEATR